MISKVSRAQMRQKKHRRLRNHIVGTAQRPRLCVFRSNNHMYAQIIDDTIGNTLVSASTLQKEVKAELEKTNNVDAAAYLGTVLGKKAVEAVLLKLYLTVADSSTREKSRHSQTQLEKLGWYSKKGRKRTHEAYNY